MKKNDETGPLPESVSLHVTHRPRDGIPFSPEGDPGSKSRVQEGLEECEDRSPDRGKKKDGGRSFPRVGVTPHDTSTSGGYRFPFFPEEDTGRV